MLSSGIAVAQQDALEPVERLRELGRIIGADHAAAAGEAQRLDDAGIVHLPRDLVGVVGQREAAEDGAWHARRRPSAARMMPLSRAASAASGGLCGRPSAAAAAPRRSVALSSTATIASSGCSLRVGDDGAASRPRHRRNRTASGTPHCSASSGGRSSPRTTSTSSLSRRRAERLGAIGAGRDEQQQPLAGDCWILRFAHGSPYFAVVESSLEIISHRRTKQRARQQTGSGGGRLTVGWSH